MDKTQDEKCDQGPDSCLRRCEFNDWSGIAEQSRSWRKTNVHFLVARKRVFTWNVWRKSPAGGGVRSCPFHFSKKLLRMGPRSLTEAQSLASGVLGVLSVVHCRIHFVRTTILSTLHILRTHTPHSRHHSFLTLVSTHPSPSLSSTRNTHSQQHAGALGICAIESGPIKWSNHASTRGSAYHRLALTFASVTFGSMSHRLALIFGSVVYDLTLTTHAASLCTHCKARGITAAIFWRNPTSFGFCSGIRSRHI